MKKLLFLTALVVTALVSYGQKVDLDKFNHTFDYRDLPRNPQNPEYKTYSVSTNVPSSVRMTYGDKGIENGVSIQGLKKVTDVKGHLIVYVSMNDLIFTASKVNERVEVQKDKDGKETGRKYYYKVDATYTWGGTGSIGDYKGTAIGSMDLQASASTWASSEYPTYKEAADYFNNNVNSIRDGLLRTEIKSALGSLNNWLSTNYGYAERTDYEILWILDSKKHPEYAAQHENWEAFKATVATVKRDAISDETKNKFYEIIKYFDGIPSKFTTDEKADKKMRYASYYNKARIYLYLDNPEAAIKEADALIANGYDDGDGKRLKKEAEALAELFKKNNATSRHFTIDLSTATPPAAN